VKVLVDTDVWSEAFRKKTGPPSSYVFELQSLIEEGRVELIGIIRMEILCGLRSAKTFQAIESRLKSFDDRALDAEIYALAAKYFNLCRSQSIQGSNNDFLICACSVAWHMPILSKDKDFKLYQQAIPIELAKPRIAGSFDD